MSGGTGIQWTDETWNPLAAFDRETGDRGWFCTKVSDGCANCYAEALNVRLGTGHLYRAKHLDDIEWRLVNLDQPARWTRPRRIFVNSMTDLFHEQVPLDFIHEVWAAMAAAPQHVFQVLTKRPARMARAVMGMSGAGDYDLRDDYGLDVPWPLPNVWVGTSVEHQEAAKGRIPHLLRTPAALRFLSCEPLLGPVNLRMISTMSDMDALRQVCCRWDDRGTRDDGLDACGGPGCDGVQVDWVIVGGESGPRARRMEDHWASNIVTQCRNSDVPVFVKQLGSRADLRHGKGGDPSEWPGRLRVREWPNADGWIERAPSPEGGDDGSVQQ